jgi:hypothetical protein
LCHKKTISFATVVAKFDNKNKRLVLCCGAGTRTAGTVTFCLIGTGTGMHYGSGPGTGFGY